MPTPLFGMWTRWILSIIRLLSVQRCYFTGISWWMGNCKCVKQFKVMFRSEIRFRQDQGQESENHFSLPYDTLKLTWHCLKKGWWLMPQYLKFQTYKLPTSSLSSYLCHVTCVAYVTRKLCINIIAMVEIHLSALEITMF